MLWGRQRQMPEKLLAALLGRLSTALAAGIDIRRAWASESSRVPSVWRLKMEAVSQSLAKGSPLAEAMEQAHGTFPPLVRAMVAVGDRTGHESQTLRELSRVLERSVRNTRVLVGSLVWPGLQLIAAFTVVGVLILLAGFIRDEKNQPVDVLGFGLCGANGLVQYLLILAAIFSTTAMTIRRAIASWHGHGIVRTIVDRFPVIGSAARLAEAGVWCRAAALASGAGLDVGRLIALSSATAPGLWLDSKVVEEQLRAGATLEETLRASRRFPSRVLEVVAVGEMTGTTAEVLDRLAEQLDEEARLGFEAAARGAGFLVWAIVASLITLVIFRVFSFYVGMIQQAAGGI